MKRMINCQCQDLKHILLFDKILGKGVDIDYFEDHDGNKIIVAVDSLTEKDL